VLLQCVKQDLVSYVVVWYVTLPQHTIKNNKADWFVCDSRPRALLRPVTCGKTGRRCVGGFYFLPVNCRTNTVQMEDARGRVLVEELKTNLMPLVIFISLIICSTCFGH